MKIHQLVAYAYAFMSAVSMAGDFSATDALRTAVASREGIKKGYDLSTILEVQSGELLDQDGSPCISLLIYKEKNTTCPDDPMVGPYFTKSSVTCFKKGTDQEVILTSMFHNECSSSLSGTQRFHSPAGFQVMELL